MYKNTVLVNSIDFRDVTPAYLALLSKRDSVIVMTNLHKNESEAEAQIEHDTVAYCDSCSFDCPYKTVMAEVRNIDRLYETRVWCMNFKGKA